MQKNFYPLKSLNTKGPIFQSDYIEEFKDPCPVFDGEKWHIYGTAVLPIEEQLYVFHATSTNSDGPWEILPLVKLRGMHGHHVAAPSVVYDKNEKIFHMFVQWDFVKLGEPIDHLVSVDGQVFERIESVIKPTENSEEAGVYDPHVAEIAGKKYMTYSGIARIGRPDIFLAKSTSDTWNGPWQKLGKILDHDRVPFHNPHDHSEYEWGLEGSQLIELPSGNVLLVAVCFLPDEKRDTRQRVFFAAASSAEGPYFAIAPVLDPKSDQWHSGENGHAAGIICDNDLLLFYQGRTLPLLERAAFWNCGIAKISISELEELSTRVLNK